MMIKIVKKGRGWFQTYEENPTATNLSMAGGGARLLSILLLIAAIPCTVAVLMAVARVSMVGSVGTALIFLMDEMDDLLLSSSGAAWRSADTLPVFCKVRRLCMPRTKMRKPNWNQRNDIT